MFLGVPSLEALLTMTRDLLTDHPSRQLGDLTEAHDARGAQNLRRQCVGPDFPRIVPNANNLLQVVFVHVDRLAARGPRERDAVAPCSSGTGPAQPWAPDRMSSPAPDGGRAGPPRKVPGSKDGKQQPSETSGGEERSGEQASLKTPQTGEKAGKSPSPMREAIKIGAAP